MDTRTFITSARPQVALITNHGYAGVEIPVGGAPDTGGQNFYVNSLAEALESLGYGVTIFARGGFPFFESERVREGEEYLADHIRYIYVPGGGDQFIRKEDIAVALDEEVEWLYGFIQHEAEVRGCPPWMFYEYINSHYWDAAVISVLLVERWSNDLAGELIVTLIGDLVDDSILREIYEERHSSALAKAPAYHLGRILIEASRTMPSPVSDPARRAFLFWAEHSKFAVNRSVDAYSKRFDRIVDQRKSILPLPLKELYVSQMVGNAILQEEPHHLFEWDGLPVSGRSDQVTYARVLADILREADRHVWTPHSLSAIKERNFKDKGEDVIRPLKFCERRDHERMICDTTRVICATSIEIAEKLHSNYRVNLERLLYFPPGVDRKIFRHYNEDELTQAYAYLSDTSNVPVDILKDACILFETSRFDYTKRKDCILEAFSSIVDDIPNVYLFIGGGPENEVFRKLIELRDADRRLVERAFLLGFIPEEHLPMMFSIADIYVSASEMEGFGMSVAQAAMSGAALICSDKIPFALQYVPDDALIVKAGDVRGFADAMKKLVEDEDERHQRVRRIVEKSAGLDWKNLAASFIEDLNSHGFRIDIPEEGGAI